jgi:dolichol-phosphate mannosyltransferase
VSVVVPVYHNAASLPSLHARLALVAESNSADQFEFVFVDDGSADESFAVLEGLARADPRVTALRLSRNFGSNAAVLAGLDAATGDVVAVIAADLQDPPELITDMLERWRRGSKVVLAVRSRRDDPGLTRFSAGVFYALFRRFAIPSMPAGGFDFFLIDRRICDLLKGIQESNAYLMGLILWLGFQPALVHYHRQRREKRYGRSRWRLSMKIKYFIDSFVAFSYAPMRLATLLGLGLSSVGLLYATVILAARLLGRAEPQGWSSIMVVLLLVSGVQLLMTGILGEYMWRNLDETKRRPRFIVDRIVSTEVPARQPMRAK